MSAVKEMLMQEAKGIEASMGLDLKTMMPLDCMIVIRFKKKDGGYHAHYVLPNYIVAKDMYVELGNMIREEKEKSPIIVPKNWQDGV